MHNFQKVHIEIHVINSKRFETIWNNRRSWAYYYIGKGVWEGKRKKQTEKRDRWESREEGKGIGGRKGRKKTKRKGKTWVLTVRRDEGQRRGCSREETEGARSVKRKKGNEDVEKKKEGRRWGKGGREEVDCSFTLQPYETSTNRGPPRLLRQSVGWPEKAQSAGQNPQTIL